MHTKMNKIKYLIIWLNLCLLLTPAMAQTTDTLKVNGKVIDASDGSAIAWEIGRAHV